MSKPVAAHDIPRESYPFTIQFFRADNDEELVDERIDVEMGPVVIQIPGLMEKYGIETWCRVTYGDGTVIESPTKEERDAKLRRG